MLKTIRTLILSLCALMLVLVASVYMVITQSNGKIISAGQTRRYMLYVPDSYDAQTPTPLVISFHGFADWPAHHMLVSGWNEIADENGFIVVYPMGTRFPLRWLAHDLTDQEGNPNPDIIFFNDLILKLKADFNIDEKRIYVNGLSNGAGFSYLLACQLSDQITAAGGVAGAYLFPWSQCHPSRPVPWIFFHGAEDTIVPYDGGSSERYDYPFPAIADFASQWAERNQCHSNSQALPPAGEISGIQYTGCSNDADVIFYTVHGGGHSWPGGSGLPRWIVGHTSHDLNASRVMWEFYQDYSLDD